MPQSHKPVRAEGHADSARKGNGKRPPSSESIPCLCSRMNTHTPAFSWSVGALQAVPGRERRERLVRVLQGCKDVERPIAARELLKAVCGDRCLTEDALVAIRAGLGRLDLPTAADLVFRHMVPRDAAALLSKIAGQFGVEFHTGDLERRLGEVNGGADPYMVFRGEWL